MGIGYQKFLIIKEFLKCNDVGLGHGALQNIINYYKISKNEYIKFNYILNNIDNLIDFVNEPYFAEMIENLNLDMISFKYKNKKLEYNNNITFKLIYIY